MPATGEKGNSQVDACTNRKMFVHDLTSFKVAVVEMYHTMLFSPVHNQTINIIHDTRNKIGLRAHSDHFLFVNDLVVLSMTSIFHFFERVHPVITR